MTAHRSPFLAADRRGSPERAGRPEGGTPQGCKQGALTGPAPGEAPTRHGAMSDRTVFDLNQLLGTRPSEDERRPVGHDPGPAGRGDVRRRAALSDCPAWAARYPEQIPTLNGEWWFIASPPPRSPKPPTTRTLTDGHA